MKKKYQLSVRIDKLTRCIEEVQTGNIISTEVLPVSIRELKSLRKREWLFNWSLEATDPLKNLYMLVNVGETIAQGLISIEDRKDHVYVHLLESARINRGKYKMYKGVPGNLMAFACKLSFDRGYQGTVSFQSKTKRIGHYQKTLGADILFRDVLVINSINAVKLIHKYFPKNS